jgi:uncharacterized repeat protein (TIGR03847 family)
MEQYDFDLDPVSFITIGTTGVPGDRTFYLQAAQGSQVVSLIIEKEHAYALGTSLQRLFTELERRSPTLVGPVQPDEAEMALLEPVAADFRAARLGVGVDEEQRQVVLVADEGAEGEDGQRARFVATFEQMQALSHQALTVVGQGRPTCPLCGESIDPEGHFCPRSNGHHRLELD